MREMVRSGPRNELEDQKVLEVLNRHLRAGIFHKSQTLPALDFTEADYDTLETKGYDIDVASVAEYNKAKAASDSSVKKVELFEAQKSLDVGWKLHLHVPPKSVAAVAAYLRDNGYVHKYRNGGDAAEGKVFTLYVGSWRKAVAQSGALSADLFEHLLQPKALDEVELARGIVGRFAVAGATPSGKVFSQYGRGYGFSVLRDRMRDAVVVDRRIRSTVDPEVQRELEITRGEILTEANIDSFRILQQEYGDYFFTEPHDS